MKKIQSIKMQKTQSEGANGRSVISKIFLLRGREILDSNNKPTVEVELKTNFGIFKSSVPSGVSTSKYEAVELRDKDGGVKKAIENIGKIIAPVLIKEDLFDQKRIDEVLIQLDGTKNKSYLGANAILVVSMVTCRAIAFAKNLSLYQYINEIYKGRPSVKLTEIGSSQSSLRACGERVSVTLPKPSFNIIEGGKHAENNLAFQEFMIVPQKENFKDNFQIGKKIYSSLKKILEKKFGGKNVGLSLEGAFTAPIEKITDAFDLILEAAEKAGYKNDIKFAIDAASSSFFDKGEYKIDKKILKKEKLIDFYQSIIQKYPIFSFEDPFEEDDWQGWETLMSNVLDSAKRRTSRKVTCQMSNVLIIGDDLTATNLERIKWAEQKKFCNAVIIKPNQIGTISETIEAAKLAKSFGWKIMVSNRAGETEDNFIADLAVGVGADFIKSGALFPKERMAKYNRLLEIEKELNFIGNK
jgi:enolase